MMDGAAPAGDEPATLEIDPRSLVDGGREFLDIEEFTSFIESVGLPI